MLVFTHGQQSEDPGSWEPEEGARLDPGLVVQVRHVELLAGRVRQLLVVLLQDLVEALRGGVRRAQVLMLSRINWLSRGMLANHAKGSLTGYWQAFARAPETHKLCSPGN